jgi:nucleoside-diphosphate-sugar epimerase
MDYTSKMDLSHKYLNKSVLVTGGASFIGSHLVDALVSLGARVKVVDDFSSGIKNNLNSSIDKIDFIEFDLRNRTKKNNFFKNVDIVFHLAAIHGGRGFIETQHRQMLDNFNIDTNVFVSSVDNEVEMIVHASSACVYPITLQDIENKRNLLSENQANLRIQGGAFPDGVYGWTKLMGEYQLETLSSNTTKGRSARIFTAYGERENLSHAAIALMAKADLRINPFPVWGSGNQTRNFTHVSDTVKGLLFLGVDEENIRFDVCNIGTSNHIPVIEFINEICHQINWKPTEWEFQKDKPVGVGSRASDNTKINQKFGWEPKLGISDGIRKTWEWYTKSVMRVKSKQELELKLLAR